jgi:hypothetical protein
MRRYTPKVIVVGILGVCLLTALESTVTIPLLKHSSYFSTWSHANLRTLALFLTQWTVIAVLFLGLMVILRSRKPKE